MKSLTDRPYVMKNEDGKNQIPPHSLSHVVDILKTAIKKIDIFTQPEASSLEVKEDGSLIAKKKNRLEKFLGFAKSFMGPLLFATIRHQQEKKLYDLKQQILQARDVLQSHSSLIEKLKTGDSSQQKLANSALEAIQRYNSILKKDYKSLARYDFYNYERNNLLSDKEIKGQLIQLPHTVSIKYDASVYSDKTKTTLKELGIAFQANSFKKTHAVKQTTHKKAEQFMLDTFRMKAIRMIQSHLPQSYSTAEILQLITQSPINLELENELVLIRQQLTIGPGSIIILFGSFKQSSDLMSMPIIDHIQLSSEATHSGFPYPSQHCGWALIDELVHAYTLRTEQIPLYRQIESRKKKLSQLLLFDPDYIAKSYQQFKLKRENFDKNKAIILPLHRQLQEAILKGCFLFTENNKKILSIFYEKIHSSVSPFDLLTSLQEEITRKFIQYPAKLLEDEWLEGNQTLLRKGTPAERFQQAKTILETSREQMISDISDLEENDISAYIRLIGSALGKASQNILLQYFSEKIGYAPPMLSDFERKVQLCAFEQLLVFLDDMEKPIDLTTDFIQDLIQKTQKDLAIFTQTIDESPAEALINELEIYFNSRYNSIVK